MKDSERCGRGVDVNYNPAIRLGGSQEKKHENSLIPAGAETEIRTGKF
jgi:hypothetical protein